MSRISSYKYRWQLIFFVSRNLETPFNFNLYHLVQSALVTLYRYSHDTKCHWRQSSSVKYRDVLSEVGASCCHLTSCFLSDFQVIKSRSMLNSRASAARQTQRGRHLDTGVLRFIVPPPSEPMRSYCCSIWGTNQARSMAPRSFIESHPPGLKFQNRRHKYISLPQSGNISNLLGNLIIHLIRLWFLSCSYVLVCV